MSQLKRPRTFLAIALLLTLVLTPTSGLEAKRKKRKKGSYVTTVHIRSVNQEGDIRGLIQSKKNDCVEGRKVRIERDGERIGSGAADAAGDYIIQTNGTLTSGDTIIAKVDKVQLGTKRVQKKGGKNKQPSEPHTGNKGKKKTKTKKTYCASDTSGDFDLNQLSVFVTGAGTVISTPEGISCRQDSGTCSALFGSTTTALDAHPDPNNDFDSWTGDCAYARSQPHCELDMDSDRSTNARFTPGSTGSPCILFPIPVLGPILCELLGFPPED